MSLDLDSLRSIRRSSIRAVMRILFVTVSLAAFAQLSSPVAADLPPPKKYKNCTELRRVYPRGVARDVKSAGSSGATIDPKTYRLNAGSDRDKDGIACE